jgi:hypothetical protein
MLAVARQIGAVPKAGNLAERAGVWLQRLAARQGRKPSERMSTLERRECRDMRRLLTIVIACAAAQTGAAYLFRRQRKRYAGDRRHILVTQGGSQLRPSGDEIGDAVVSVMMGGVLLDLRESQLTDRPAHLDILSIMGGVQLVVPGDWKVRIAVESTMAGIHDGRTGTVDPERQPDIVLSGRVVMSGLDISSEMPGNRHRRSAT